MADNYEQSYDTAFNIGVSIYRRLMDLLLLKQEKK